MCGTYLQMTLDFPLTEMCCLKKGMRKGNDRGSDRIVVTLFTRSLEVEIALLFFVFHDYRLFAISDIDW